jgi:hypothetical protein
MVYAAGPGLTYTELKAMDLREYAEAVEARLIWQKEWNPKPPTPTVRNPRR